MKGSARRTEAAAANNCYPATATCAGTRVSAVGAALGILQRLPKICDLPVVWRDKDYNFHNQKWNLLIPFFQSYDKFCHPLIPFPLFLLPSLFDSTHIWVRVTIKWQVKHQLKWRNQNDHTKYSVQKLATTFPSATSRYGKQRVQHTMKDKVIKPRWPGCTPGTAPCHSQTRAPKTRGLLLIWMREEYCGLSISSPVLIMQNIGQPQSLQVIIIRSPWSQQLGNKHSGLALNAHSLGICLTLSCSLYKVLALITAAVTAAGSSASIHLQKRFFLYWSKQQLQLEKNTRTRRVAHSRKCNLHGFTSE